MIHLLIRRKNENRTKLIKKSTIICEKSGPKFSRKLVSPLSIFQHLLVYTVDFSASWVGNTAGTEPEDGWAEGGKADRKTFVSWNHVGTTTASLLYCTVLYYRAPSVI
jgi:hypothetical protein